MKTPCLLVLFLVFGLTNAQGLDDIIVQDQTQMQAGKMAYVFLYQKTLYPYPEYVTIWDLGIFSGGTNDNNNWIFHPGTILTAGAEQTFANGYTLFGSTQLKDATVNMSLTYDTTKKFPHFNVYPSDSLNGKILLSLAPNLPVSATGIYAVYLARSDGASGQSRRLVPSALVTQPPGEEIEVVLPAANKWYLAVGTTPHPRGSTVHHSLLPTNEVVIETGQVAVVTGNIRVGFTITVSY